MFLPGKTIDNFDVNCIIKIIELYNSGIKFPVYYNRNVKLIQVIIKFYI